VTDGTDAALLSAVRSAVEGAKAKLVVIAPKVGGFTPARGKPQPADAALNGSPSVLFDAVVLLPSAAGAAELAGHAAAIDFVRDAYGHLKSIGFDAASRPLLEKAGINADSSDRGLVAVDAPAAASAFVAQAKQGKVWEREPSIRPAP
jgi:catalase